jgi:predicted RNase H-like nuclease (RuvC/YqgF family)
VGPEEGGEGAREIATHPTLSTEADMVEMLEQLEFMNQRLASLHSDNLGLRKLLETVKNERDNLFEKLAVSVPPVDMISKVESSIDTKANQELLIDHSQNVLELEKLRAELAKKSEEIQSLTAKLRSFESGRGNLTANVSKDHYIDGAPGYICIIFFLCDECYITCSCLMPDELVQGSLPHKAHQHDAYSRSHGGEGDGAFIQAASDGEEGVVEFGDIMRSRLQTELEVTRDALRTEKLLAQKNIAKMQEVIASLKAQLRDGKELLSNFEFLNC